MCTVAKEALKAGGSATEVLSKFASDVGKMLPVYGGYNGGYECGGKNNRGGNGNGGNGNGGNGNNAGAGAHRQGDHANAPFRSAPYADASPGVRELIRGGAGAPSATSSTSNTSNSSSTTTSPLSLRAGAPPPRACPPFGTSTFPTTRSGSTWPSPSRATPRPATSTSSAPPGGSSPREATAEATESLASAGDAPLHAHVRLPEQPNLHALPLLQEAGDQVDRLRHDALRVAVAAAAALARRHLFCRSLARSPGARARQRWARWCFWVCCALCVWRARGSAGGG